MAISHYAWSNSYTRANIFVVSNSMVGGVSGALRGTVRLFELPKENRELSERIAELECELESSKSTVIDSVITDQIRFNNPSYSYIVAKVVSNSINKKDNFILLDKGVEDGVYEKMAVITPTGEVLGHVAACTGHYSAALSVLSKSFTTSGKLAGGKNYGSISWDGKDRYNVTMSELSKYEPINIGDTVVSTGFSHIFPGGVTIGQVAGFELNEMGTAYEVDVELAAEITAIDYVLLVGNSESGEIENLMESVDNTYN